MNNIWKDLPADLVDKILLIHYRDIHYKLNKSVINQILYYLKEFNYHRRRNIYSIWFRTSSANYHKFALYKSNLKKEINITSSNKPISRILRKQLNILNKYIAAAQQNGL